MVLTTDNTKIFHTLFCMHTPISYHLKLYLPIIRISLQTIAGAQTAVCGLNLGQPGHNLHFIMNLFYSSQQIITK